MIFHGGPRPKAESGGWVPGEGAATPPHPIWGLGERCELGSGVGFLGRGQQPPPHPIWGLGIAVSSPSGVWDGAPSAERFSLFSALSMASPDTIILLTVDIMQPLGGWGGGKTAVPPPRPCVRRCFSTTVLHILP